MVYLINSDLIPEGDSNESGYLVYYRNSDNKPRKLDKAELGGNGNNASPEIQALKSIPIRRAWLGL